MAWDKNELVALGIIIVSVTILTLTGRVEQGNYMLIMSSSMAYTFGRIMNHAQGKEPPN
jgi:hypothetical protein